MKNLAGTEVISTALEVLLRRRAPLHDLLHCNSRSGRRAVRALKNPKTCEVRRLTGPVRCAHRSVRLLMQA